MIVRINVMSMMSNLAVAVELRMIGKGIHFLQQATLSVYSMAPAGSGSHSG